MHLCEDLPIFRFEYPKNLFENTISLSLISTSVRYRYSWFYDVQYAVLIILKVNRKISTPWHGGDWNRFQRAGSPATAQELRRAGAGARHRWPRHHRPGGLAHQHQAQALPARYATGMRRYISPGHRDVPPPPPPLIWVQKFVSPDI